MTAGRIHGEVEDAIGRRRWVSGLAGHGRGRGEGKKVAFSNLLAKRRRKRGCARDGWLWVRDRREREASQEARVRR